jgi:hypothetical protein
MATQGPPPSQSTGVELTTLVISAIASAAAAYITSKIWAPGTLVSAAMTPVIVALVKEGLRKPTEAVANVATVSRWTRTAPDDAALEPDPGAPPLVPADPAAPRVDPDAPHVLLPPVVKSGETSPVSLYSTRARRLRWRLALMTGLLGFAVCVVAFTVPELLAGESLGGSHKTTIFGGHSKHHHKSRTTSTSTSTTPTATTKTATTPAKTQTTRTVTQTETVTTPATTPDQTPTTTTQTPPPAASDATPSSTAPATP